MAGEMQEARRVRWRRRSLVDSDQTKIALEARPPVADPWRIGTVVDDDHFVIVGIDMALVAGGQRLQRPGASRGML